MTLEESYNETGPKIVGYLVATGTDESTAMDLLHDAVVRVVKRLDGASAAGRPGDDIPALLFVTARNLRANRVRHDSKVSFVGDARDSDVRRADAGAQGLGRPAVDAAYLRSRIGAALRELPEAQREAYVLYQIGERCIREIAEITGAGESLVKVRIHRAKLALRSRLCDLCTATADIQTPKPHPVKKPCSRQTRFR